MGQKFAGANLLFLKQKAPPLYPYVNHTAHRQPEARVQIDVDPATRLSTKPSVTTHLLDDPFTTTPSLARESNVALSVPSKAGLVPGESSNHAVSERDFAAMQSEPSAAGLASMKPIGGHPSAHCGVVPVNGDASLAEAPSLQAAE